MAWRISDCWLWLGLGFVAYGAFLTLQKPMGDLFSATESNSPLKENSEISLDTEDAIPSDSLMALAHHSNVDIRNAATKMLVYRVVRDRDATYSILTDSKSQDEETRIRGRLAINLCQKYYKRAFLSPQIPEAVGLRRTGLMPRVRDGSVEEQAQRRRRREAIVLNEGGGPVTQEDIIQRRGTNDLEAFGQSIF